MRRGRLCCPAAEWVGLPQRNGKGHSQRLVVSRLAPDIADQPATARAQETEFAVVALQLLGMGVALDHPPRPLGDPNIDLPYRNILIPGPIGRASCRERVSQYG